MRITDFSVTKQGRIALFVDGEFVFSVHPDLFASSGLSVGTELDEEALEELRSETAYQRAKEKALTLLSYKEYTSKELEDRLVRSARKPARRSSARSGSGFREEDSAKALEESEQAEAAVREEAAARAVERMQELGLLNDDDYAQRYARDLSERKHFGMHRVKQEMRRKGLSPDQIEDAVALLDDAPEEQIRELLLKKYPLAWEDERVKRRAFAALARLGYSAGDIRRALQMEREFE